MDRHCLPIGLIFLVLGLITACTGTDNKKPETTATPLTPTETVTHVVSQSQTLMLQVTSPEINMVTELNHVHVAGRTSPDATLSVNGHLLYPDREGLFEIELPFSNPSKPMVIEVIASSITGESKSEIRPIIYSGQSIQSGLFGKVRSVTPSNITLDTESSAVSLSVDSGTSITIHGWKYPSISDITAGTVVGVMRQGAQAKSILAVPIRPVLTRHFTGVVTDTEILSSPAKSKITLIDSSKRQITVDAADEMAEVLVGSLVTAILEQDLSSGDLIATAIDPAFNSAKRISNALASLQEIDSGQAKENVKALSWRLAEHGVRNVSMLLDQQPYEGWEDSVTSAEKTYTRLFAKHHVGPPSADVTGLVTSIATSLGTSSTKLITIQPAIGQPVMVKLSETTPIALFGDRIQSGQLDLASRITVRYSIKGNVASRVTVMAGNTLSRESSAQLAAIAARGEVQGLLMNVVGPGLEVSILVDQKTGKQMSLTSERALIFHNGMPIELDSAMEGSNIFAWYDPATYRLLEIESLDVSMDEDLVSGVVESFIPKFADGNLTIRTIDGQLRALTHHADTVIRRNGLRVSIHDVRPGDLVRPNTKVRTSKNVDEILSLSLKTPELGRTSGFIRGVITEPDGQVQVTISNIWLDLIILKVTSNTRISQQGLTVEIQDLKVGQEVNLATYDLVTLETDSLALNPSIESARANR